MVTKRLLSLFVPMALALMALPSWAISQLSATVDQNPVIQGQSVQLVVEADASADREDLDLSALEADFAIGRTNINKSTQIINMEMQRATTWTILLLPKRAGTLTIPALELDGVLSQPIQLRVLPPEQAKELGQVPLAYIETELDRNRVLPGQPLILTLKLFLGAELQRGSLNAPEHPQLQLQQLGQDQSSSEIIEGKRYHVIERQYLISGDTPGEYDLGAANFRGDLLVSGTRQDFFARPQARSMFSQSEPIRFTIEPRPVSYQGSWLVADIVSLSDDLDTETRFEVGQPITRNLLLSAIGTTPDSLPELTLSVPEGLRLYPDKTERGGGPRDGQLIAQLKQSVAIVPNQPGSYTLPALKVPWWNARLKRQEWAELPERTIQVEPASGLAPVTPALPQPETQPEPMAPAQTDAGFWPWLSLGLALLWLATLWWGWQRRRPQAQPAAQPQLRPLQAEKALLQACKDNDADKALATLPRWGTEFLGRSVTLAQLGQALPSLAQPIAALQSSRYGSDPQPWQGDALQAAVRALPPPQAKGEPCHLPAMDPTTRMS